MVYAGLAGALLLPLVEPETEKQTGLIVASEAGFWIRSDAAPVPAIASSRQLALPVVQAAAAKSRSEEAPAALASTQTEPLVELHAAGLGVRSSGNPVGIPE